MKSLWVGRPIEETDYKAVEEEARSQTGRYLQRTQQTAPAATLTQTTTRVKTVVKQSGALVDVGRSGGKSRLIGVAPSARTCRVSRFERRRAE